MTMTEPYCDALVLFGATGDLAYKQVFPALQAMFKHGHLDLPVIGVAGGRLQPARSWPATINGSSRRQRSPHENER